MRLEDSLELEWSLRTILNYCGIHSDISTIIVLPRAKRTTHDMWQNKYYYQSGCRSDSLSFGGTTRLAVSVAMCGAQPARSTT